MHAEPTKPRPVSAFRSWHNHMRADHPKLWHPIRITIVVITVWWILFCLLLAPTDNPAAIVWTIIEIAVLLLSPFFPKSMSLLFLIMSQSGPWLIPAEPLPCAILPVHRDASQHSKDHRDWNR